MRATRRCRGSRGASRAELPAQDPAVVGRHLVDPTLAQVLQLVLVQRVVGGEEAQPESQAPCPLGQALTVVDVEQAHPLDQVAARSAQAVDDGGRRHVVADHEGQVEVGRGKPAHSRASGLRRGRP